MHSAIRFVSPDDRHYGRECLILANRQKVYERVKNCKDDKILITHGTDTMVATAQRLNSISGKTIVLTGSMQPARFKDSDAIFNIGCAIGVLIASEPGTYIAMNGQRFLPDNVTKNVAQERFENTGKTN